MLVFCLGFLLHDFQILYTDVQFLASLKFRSTENSNCRSAKRFITFKRCLKTEVFDVACSKLEHSAVMHL